METCQNTMQATQPAPPRPVHITFMLRTCPKCKGRAFREAYYAGMYFISCCACGEFKMCAKASEAVEVWCSEEVAA